MNTRRAIVWTISSLVGAISVAAVLFGFKTTLDRFTWANALIIFLSFGSLTFIWLDYIFRTEYLRS